MTKNKLPSKLRNCVGFAFIMTCSTMATVIATPANSSASIIANSAESQGDGQQNVSYNHGLNKQLQQELRQLEHSESEQKKAPIRIGVFAINQGNGDTFSYRADEIFPTGCTSKVIGVGAVLKRSQDQPKFLDQIVSYSKNDLKSWSPVTEKHVETGMTVRDLCGAAIYHSDNTAMNLLLQFNGGVEGMTEFARFLGDTHFLQTNDWPKEAYSGGKNNRHDASTPKTMAFSLQKLLTGSVLGDEQKKLLKQWLIDAKHGLKRIRSGVPSENWVVGNKTGTGGNYGTTNDLAVIYPPNHEPLFICVYYTSDDERVQKNEDILVTVTKKVISAMQKADKTL